MIHMELGFGHISKSVARNFNFNISMINFNCNFNKAVNAPWIASSHSVQSRPFQGLCVRQHHDV